MQNQRIQPVSDRVLIRTIGHRHKEHAMANVARKVLLTAMRMLATKDYVSFRGSILPPIYRRWCGPEFDDNAFFLKSAESEANRLVTHLGCGKETRVLDVGCGYGRLPIGIIRVIGEINYIGMDVHQGSIEWCKRHIQRGHPSFLFRYLDVWNDRYNRQGTVLDQGFRFDLYAKSIDIVYLFSVFSHMTEDDMRIYLKDFVRILDDGGKIFFTTFVEENVPKVSINPEDDICKRCSGPLHVVRYEKDHLFGVLSELGYAVDEFVYRTETDGQSAIYLSRE